MDNGNTIEKGIAGKIAEAKTIEYAVRRLEEVEKEWDDRMNPNCAWGNAISNLHDKICEEWDKIPANVDLNNQCVELQAKLRSLNKQIHESKLSYRNKRFNELGVKEAWLTYPLSRL